MNILTRLILDAEFFTWRGFSISNLREMARRGRKKKVVKNKEVANQLVRVDDFSIGAPPGSSEDDSDSEGLSDTNTGNLESSGNDENSPSRDDLLGDGPMGQFLIEQMGKNPGLTIKQLLNKLRVAASTIRTYELQWKAFCRYILEQAAIPTTAETPEAFLDEMIKLLNDVEKVRFHPATHDALIKPFNAPCHAGRLRSYNFVDFRLLYFRFYSAWAWRRNVQT